MLLSGHSSRPDPPEFKMESVSPWSFWHETSSVTWTSCAVLLPILFGVSPAAWHRRSVRVLYLLCVPRTIGVDGGHVVPVPRTPPRGGRSQPTVNPPPPSFSPWMRQPLNLFAFLLWQAGGQMSMDCMHAVHGYLVPPNLPESECRFKGCSVHGLTMGEPNLPSQAILDTCSAQMLLDTMWARSKPGRRLTRSLSNQEYTGTNGTGGVIRVVEAPQVPVGTGTSLTSRFFLGD